MHFQRVFVILFFGCLILFSPRLYGQDPKPGFKSWFDYTMSYRLSKKYSFSFNQIWSLNVNPYRVGFIQNDLRLTYRLKYRTFLSIGYVWSLFKDSPSLRNRYDKIPNFTGMLGFSRVYTQFSYKHNFYSKRVQLKHTGSFQYFFPQLKKYQYRLTYAAKLYFRVKNFPWRGVPFVENKFFVYLGGVPARYYDETGNIIDRRSTNGIHRYRIKTGIRFRPSKKRFYLTPYFFFQKEFNPGFLSSDLNIAIPNSNRVSYRFNDYFVAGLNLEYKFKRK